MALSHTTISNGFTFSKYFHGFFYLRCFVAEIFIVKMWQVFFNQKEIKARSL